MNESITIKGVTSYHHSTPQYIDLSKKNTFIFGLNGTGKSTISNFLYDVDSFPKCKLNIEGEFSPVVYNQKFIEDNFLKKHTQEGVFTLSKENADLEKRINERLQLRGQLRAIYKEIKTKKNAEEYAIEEIKQNAINEIYKKKDLIHNTSLDFFLTGYKKPKINFYNQVKSQTGLADESIDSLEAEYNELNKYSNIKPLKVKLPPLPEISEEDYEILAEPIITSSNSQLTSFIEQVDNLYWVKTGIENYLAKEQTKCPFCQNETIDNVLRSELSKLFDQSYKLRIKKLQEIESNYHIKITEYSDLIRDAFTACSVYDEEKHHILPLIELLEREQKDNLKLITSKTQKPNTTVFISNCKNKLTPIKEIASNINISVDNIYQKSNEFEHSKNNIRDRMWKTINYLSKDIFSFEKTTIESKEKEIKKLDQELNKIARIGEKVKNRISILRSKTSNIDETIDRINENLIVLGITGFEIIKPEDPNLESYFMLSRKGLNDNVFQTLSEGEKTLITFLYFIEMCNGSMSKDSEIPDNDKIIVIDDPISSLSQNYIYDIASLIQTKIIKGNRFKKVIILTHSLFFFHELLKLSNKSSSDFDNSYSLYRVTKNQHSIISSMHRDELKNDYQSLWHILKDVIDLKTDPIVLPNVMRNILEYYFGFVHRKEQLSKILNELAEQEPNQGHKAFYRYINRESHSDPTNIGFMTNISPDSYLERFKRIFEKTQDETHYKRMME